jgi:hypothetical protein
MKQLILVVFCSLFIYSCNSSNEQDYIRKTLKVKELDSIKVDNLTISDSLKVHWFIETIKTVKEIDLHGKRLNVLKKYDIINFNNGKQISDLDLLETKNHGTVIVVWGQEDFIGFRTLLGYYTNNELRNFKTIIFR